MLMQLEYSSREMSSALNPALPYGSICARRADPPLPEPAAAGQTSSIGRTVSCALRQAVYEKRVVVGVAAAVKELLSNRGSTTTTTTTTTNSPTGAVMFCVLAPAGAGDSATHMSRTLLEAFCYETGIYMVPVDSARKLSRLLGTRQTEMCALIQRPWRETEEMEMTAAEEAMADHCEEYWDVQQPMVHLPD